MITPHPRAALALSLVTVALAIGCSGDTNAPEKAEPDPEPEPVCDIPELFVQRCNGETCHGGGTASAAGLDLISPNVEDRITDVPGTNCTGLLADSSNPRASLLYTKITEPVCGAIMPMGTEPLDEDEVTCMEYWLSGLLPPVDGCMDCACEPGVVEDCYSGPQGTANVGICKNGTRMCQTDGLGWLACEGEALPFGEDCFTPDVDENCDGKTPECSEVWALRFGDENDQGIRSVVLDNVDGDVYSFGDFQGLVSFGAEPLLATPSDISRQDLVVIKHDLYGNPLWSRRFGDSSTQKALAMAMDADGNLVFVGYVNGSIDVGGGALKAKGGNDVVIFKLDGEGNHIWSRLLGGKEPDRAVRLAFDAERNVILTGAFGGTADFGVEKFSSVGQRDAFVVELERDTGEITSAMQIGGEGDDYGFGVDVDSNGEVVIAGRFGGPLELGGQMLDHAGDLDIYLARLDTSGKVLWARSFGGPGTDEIHDLRLQQNGDMVLVGAISDTVDFGGDPLESAGLRDIFLATLDGQGKHVWSASWGDALDQVDMDPNYNWLSLVLDQAGNIYIGGTLYGTFDFGAGAKLTANGEKSDLFHAQFTADGDYLGGRRFGGKASDIGHDFAVTEAGHVLQCGRFQGKTLDMKDAGTLENAGRSDGFLVKLAPL